jgi:regulatory protein
VAVPPPSRRREGTESAADDAEKVRDAALRLLARRERSAAELRTRLIARGFPPPVVERVLERLQEAGLQDDGRFAEQYASDAAARGAAGRRINRDLLGRGIDRELAVVASTERPEVEEQRARAAARKRAATMHGTVPEVRFRRLIGFLARRGYDADLCREVAAEVSGFDPSTEAR